MWDGTLRPPLWCVSTAGGNEAPQDEPGPRARPQMSGPASLGQGQPLTVGTGASGPTAPLDEAGVSGPTAPLDEAGVSAGRLGLGRSVVIAVAIATTASGLEAVGDHPQQGRARTGERLVQALRDIAAVAPHTPHDDHTINLLEQREGI